MRCTSGPSFGAATGDFRADAMRGPGQAAPRADETGRCQSRMNPLTESKRALLDRVSHREKPN